MSKQKQQQPASVATATNSVTVKSDEAGNDQIEKLSRALLKQSDDTNIAVFGANLFAKAAKEDLANYTVAELVSLVKKAFKNLKKRPNKRHAINIYNPTIRADKAYSNNITVIDIVNDNMPFLVDSIMGELQNFGATIILVAHPIIGVGRNEDGELTSYYNETSNDEVQTESVISIHIERYQAKTVLEQLRKRITKVLNEVRMAVNDWMPMNQLLNDVIIEYRNHPPKMSADELTEALQFLEWLSDNNFTFLGMREYSLHTTKNDDVKLRQIKGYGILHDPNVKVLRRNRQMVTITPEILEFFHQPIPLIVTKSNVKSRIHRHTYMDYVGVKLFNKVGELKGELRIVGLFTSTAYTRSVRSIPYLRRKTALVMSHTGVVSGGHSAKVIANILEEFPRDELFQISVSDLSRFVIAIMQLEERPRIRALIRRDKFDRFVSALIYIPRDRYNTRVREQIGNYLKEVFDGHISTYYIAYPEGNHARVHFIIGRAEGKTPDVSEAMIETQIGDIVRTWNDELRKELSDRYPPEHAHEIYSHNLNTFSNSYKESFAATQAVKDIKTINQLNDDNNIAIDWHQHDNDKNISLRLFHLDKPIPLSDRIPLIENMGFRAINERSYSLKMHGTNRTFWLHDIVLKRTDGLDIDLKTHRHDLHQCYFALWRGAAESDPFNSLVLLASLNWREVALLRAIGRYFLQTNINYSQDYICRALANNTEIARLLIDLFVTRFDPDQSKKNKNGTIIATINEKLNDVSSLDEDVIIRRYVNFITSMLRTNFYQHKKDGEPPYAITFKYNPERLDGLPEPRPSREMYVYSPRVEGVHLRFGMIARGGIRWSDRLQDYRTEILGLAKAQQVKNSVIVPLGAKGGFVVKQPPKTGSRDEFIAEGIACYKIFIKNLLDITDNITGKGITSPADTVKLDEDDPYLVVAADKGTATFSDIANSISTDKKFWLGDAFASGGSNGYDHKKIGITARGAWESVKRHFREMDIDIQNQPFTVAGVGDMSGDVFGNGMLLSKHIKLVAAFDHRDIFIDPDPDPKQSFAERERIFKLKRSSWQDYNKDLLTKGGGVYSRQLKSIELSPQALQALGIKNKKPLTPNELITNILKAEVDLLWFGGIGTYISASSEDNNDVGDKTNDNVRALANQIRARVIGEGANLGMTQKARIEFNSLGGRCNTDAIDNSAGVNMSDLEVNIKIAFDQVIKNGNLDLNGRNKLLVKMTEQTSTLCLTNNYLQTLALSLALKRRAEDFEYWCQFIRHLSLNGQLNRGVEYLPDGPTLHKRRLAGDYLMRAELCVLLAYAKNTLYKDLLDTSIIDDPYFEKELKRYFPLLLIEKYFPIIKEHRLRREIIATVLANAMINRGGPAYITRLNSLSSADLSEIVAAYIVTRDTFDLTAYNKAIDSLDNKISGDIQLDLYNYGHELILNLSNWFIANTDLTSDLGKLAQTFTKGCNELTKHLSTILPAKVAKYTHTEYKRLTAAKVPDDLAARAVKMPFTAAMADIVMVSEQSKKPLLQCAAIYFKIVMYFEIYRLYELINKIKSKDYYDKISCSKSQIALADTVRVIATTICRQSNISDPDVELDSYPWFKQNQTAVRRVINTIHTITANDILTVSEFSVASGLLAELGKRLAKVKN